MTAEDAENKPRLDVSETLLDQENSEKHQQGGGGGQGRKNAGVAGQAAVGHHAQTAPAEDGYAGDQRGGGQDVAHSIPLRDWQGLVAISGLAVALLGFGTLVVTAFQLGAMKDQLEQMKISNDKVAQSITQATRQADAAENANTLAAQALSSADRAWVYPLVSIGGPLVANQPFIATIQFMNSGHTPATNVRMDFSLRVIRGEMPPDFSSTAGNLGEMIIYPGTQATETITADAARLTDALVAEITDRKATLHVLGMIQYKDVNAKVHRSKYCSYYNIDVKAMVPCAIEGSNYAD